MVWSCESNPCCREHVCQQHVVEFIMTTSDVSHSKMLSLHSFDIYMLCRWGTEWGSLPSLTPPSFRGCSSPSSLTWTFRCQRAIRLCTTTFAFHRPVPKECSPPPGTSQQPLTFQVRAPCQNKSIVFWRFCICPSKMSEPWHTTTRHLRKFQYGDIWLRQNHRSDLCVPYFRTEQLIRWGYRTSLHDCQF